MRFLIPLAFLLVGEYYAFQLFLHFYRTTTSTCKATSLGIYLTLTTIEVIYIICLFTNLNDQFPKPLNSIWGALTFIIILSKFVGGVFLFADDLRRIGLWIIDKVGINHEFNAGRSTFLSKTALVFSSIPFLSLTWGMIRNPYNYKVFRLKLPIKNLSKDLEGFTIVQISDIHAGSFLFKEPIKRAVELINEAQPDLVCFTGDLVNNKADEIEEYMDIFSAIKAPLGVYSVLGNHDYGNYVSWPSPEAKIANMDQLKRNQAQMGWELLLNEHRLLEVGDSTLAVIGVENQSASKRFPQRGDLVHASEQTEQADFRLLLSHDPSHWNQEVTTSFKQIELTLSGHTHGMQFGIEIPGFIKWSPAKFLYKQWAGLYQNDGQALYVNRGLGYLGYPGRVGIKPEITVIELTKES